MDTTSINRYTDSDLEEFRVIIEKKLADTTNQYQNLLEQIKEITENTSGDYTKDITDFSSSQSEVEMLNTIATRQRTFIQDLQAALVRIKNKSYGICVVTGALIDKKRLIAVPTTTKSLAAKQVSETAALKALHKNVRKEERDDEEDEIREVKKKAEPKKPLIITKVIKKSNPSAPKKSVAADDDDEFDSILSELDGIEDVEKFEDDDVDDLDSGEDYEEPYEELPEDDDDMD